MELDDAYSQADNIPNGHTYAPRWATEAAAFRAALGERAEIGLSYGESERQAYDLFHPKAATHRTVMFVHGGYWRISDKSYWSHLAAGPLAHGWSVAMPSYDLCPAVHIRDITRQIAQAVQAVAARSTGPIALTGHSAGGHLVARMLDRALLPEDVAERLSAVVPIAPLADLRPLRQTSMNADFHMDAAEALAESPLLMTDRRDVPVTIWVGAQERPALLAQARWLADAWGAERVVVPDRHHFDVIDDLADPGSRMVEVLTS